MSSQEYVKSNPETPWPWYVYSESDRAVNSLFQRLRSFNSYPNLRQESSWIASYEWWKFYDDTHVSGYCGSEFDEFWQICHRQPKTEDEGDDGIKNIAVDTFDANEVPSAPPLTELSIPPCSLSSPQVLHRTEGVRRNDKRTHDATRKSEMVNKLENDEREVRDFRRPPSKLKSSSSSPSQVPRTKGVRKNAKRTYHASEESEMIENEENNKSEVRVFHSPPPPSRPPPPLRPPFSPSGEEDIRALILSSWVKFHLLL